ncbi:MAG: TIGR01777 family oxidoreductase [Thiomicrospira sp.]|jgi:uncharacterized protein (TIGR01777 family)
MDIVILGGTGFVGRALSAALREEGHQVTSYGRKLFESDTALTNALNQQSVLIMLNGANIGQRWSDAYKRELWRSRIDVAGQVQRALSRCDQPPQRIFCTSAIGLYPQNTCNQPHTEACTDVDSSFLGELGQAWEQASLALTPTPTILRFGVVLGKNGGALAKMLPAFKLGLGGPIAGGKQCFSWIHIEDLINAYRFLLANPHLNGTFNLTSPNPLSQADFGRALAQTLHRPFWLPMPEWQLKLMFGEGAQVLTHSSAVIPERLIQAGFEFQFPQISEALSNIINTKA